VQSERAARFGEWWAPEPENRRSAVSSATPEPARSEWGLASSERRLWEAGQAAPLADPWEAVWKERVRKEGRRVLMVPEVGQAQQAARDQPEQLALRARFARGPARHPKRP